MTDARRVFREGVRMQAAELFTEGQSNAVIAKRLRVSMRSVQRWRRAWCGQGRRALSSAGSPGRPTLSRELFAALEHELVKGPVAHGWPDQVWTLERIKTLIGRRFHKSMTLSGISQMLRRNGWSHQVPARRASERDPATVTGWVKDTWPQVKAPRRRSGHGWPSRTRPASR
ncbi:winged helix-turn-helix domain-containing protein [Spirillospora sp. NPDC049652]